MKTCYNGSVNSKRDHPAPPPGGAFVGHLSFLKNNVANAPRWGQLIRTNPHAGAPGRVQTPDPWDKIIVVIHDESANWLADQNGVSNSKGSLCPIHTNKTCLIKSGLTK